jgi:hypothetical protein
LARRNVWPWGVIRVIGLSRRRDEINAGTAPCERCKASTRYVLALHYWEAALGPWSARWSKRFYRQCTRCGTLVLATPEEAAAPTTPAVEETPSELEAVKALRERLEYARATAAGEKEGLIQRAHPSVWGVVQEYIGPVAADWLRRTGAVLDPAAATRLLEKEFMGLATHGFLLFHVEENSVPSGTQVDPVRALRRADRLQTHLDQVVSQLMKVLSEECIQRLEHEGIPLPGKHRKEVVRMLVKVACLGFAVGAEEWRAGRRQQFQRPRGT